MRKSRFLAGIRIGVYRKTPILMISAGADAGSALEMLSLIAIDIGQESDPSS